MRSTLTGFLNVNKSAGMTAHDVVARVRKLSGTRQVGHAGTLDPMATGVLPVALGKACRLLRFLDDDKTYVATVLFGVATDTDDVEGKIIATNENIPAEIEIAAALKNFAGVIEQVPPLYSAIHVDGERLYKLARRGESPVEIPKRQVEIFSIDVLGYRNGVGNPARYPASTESGEAAGEVKVPWAELDLKIHCGTGTYIRSIARDLGTMLNSAACLSVLLREQSGKFKVDQSHCLDELNEASANGTLTDLLKHPEDILPMPKIELNAESQKRLSQGQRIKVNAPGLNHPFVLALAQGKAMAVCCVVDFDVEKVGGESDIVELKPEVVLVDGSSN